MKRVLMVFLCFTMMFSAFARSYEPVFTESPFLFTEIESMGGASVAVSNGFEALFNNPAGFSSSGGEIVFTSLNIYGDMIPNQAAVESLISIANNHGSIDTDQIISDLVALGTEDGIETSFNVGAGISAFGLGLGFISEVDIELESDVASEYMAADVSLESELVAGLSHSFDLGFAALQLGANAKGLLFLDIDTITIDDLESMDIDNPLAVPATLTMGYGLDAGAILDFDYGVSVGVAVENIGGTDIFSTGDDLDAIVNDIENDPEAYWNDLISTGDTDTIPMSAKVGIGYESPRGSLLGLRLAADYELDLEELFDQPRSRMEYEKTLIDQLQLGAEVSLLGMAKVRAGLNQGYITGGASLNLLLVEVSATYYGDYYKQDQYRSIVLDEDSSEQLIIGAKVKL